MQADPTISPSLNDKSQGPSSGSLDPGDATSPVSAGIAADDAGATADAQGLKPQPEQAGPFADPDEQGDIAADDAGATAMAERATGVGASKGDQK